MPKFFIRTYGCQMNERDSEQVVELFQQRGYRRTDLHEEADVILLNTCSVREQAERKAFGKMGMMRADVRRAEQIQREWSEPVYAYLGCMAQNHGAELTRKPVGVDLVLGTQKYHHVVDYVEEIQRRRDRMNDPRYAIVDIEEELGSEEKICDHGVEKLASAYVSIMQGCDMRCAFCIVPKTRGVERSRSPREILREVETLAASGVKQIVLLGQIVNLYGRKCEFFPELAGGGKSSFTRLLELICEVDGIERVRFSSPHPIGFGEDLINAFAEQDKLAAHVHLPLQSGSNRILRKMRRPYKVERYLKIVDALRNARAGIAITTDFIVGFPNESEEDFAKTLAIAEKVRFDNAYIFRYSDRDGTPASFLPIATKFSQELKRERNQRLLKVINKIAGEKSLCFLGKTLNVLCEGLSKTDKNRLQGRSSCNRIVVFDGELEKLAGEFVRVKVVETTPFTLFGELV